MEKIRCFIECLLPVTACNLKCHYCYVIQNEERKMEIPKLRYSPQEIGNALTKERFNGLCFFSICGAGETLLPDYSIEIIYEILKNGHVVNVTTNGTLTNRFKQLCSFPNEYREKLMISFSLHYIELKKRGLLNTFFDNVRLIKENGISFVVQINLCDEYIELEDEIKKLCLEKLGALPQVAATRKEGKNINSIELFTNLKKEEYLKKGLSYNSPLFEFTMKNFNVQRKEFCYAGDWSFSLNLLTGLLRKCYCEPDGQYIFDKPYNKIRFEAIGNNCKSFYCINSSHFLSLGTIPGIYQDISYSGLRNRIEAKWYNEYMRNILSQKLIDANKEYSFFRKKYVNFKYFVKKLFRKAKNVLNRIKGKVKRNE